MMKQDQPSLGGAAANPEILIRQVLECALGRRIVQLVHHRSDYESSYELENVEVALDDGSVLEMIFKKLGPSAILPDARAAKPPFLYHPLREMEMYHTILSPEQHGTPICHARSTDERSGRYWLFLQRIQGLKLSYVGEFSIWQEAVRWLAAFHAQFVRREAEIAKKVPVIDYDAAYISRWCDRAADFVARTHAAGSSASTAMNRVHREYGHVVERLGALPRTLLHGECYPSNLLVRDVPSAQRICPVDWEMAALGPGLIDLAALTAGNWTPSQRFSLIESYWSVIQTADRSAYASLEQLLTALDWCRLHLAVQWLGWSPHWAPPIEQANDWFLEMLSLADRLKIL